MRNTLVLSALFAALFSGGAAAAPDYIRASPDELAKKYGEGLVARVFSDELTALRAARIRESVTYIPRTDCPEKPNFVLREVQPFQLEKSNVMWIERFDVACKSPRRRSLLMVKQGEAIAAVPMAPGNTLANVIVQADAGKIAQKTALAGDPGGCRQATVIETHVTHPPARSGAPWEERWAIYACGKTIGVAVTFAPSGGANPKIAAVKEGDRPTAKVDPRGLNSGTPESDRQRPAELDTAAPERGRDWGDCQWTKRLSDRPDMRIAACERVVAGPKLAKADLSTAYRWLGDALRVKAASAQLDFLDKFELSERVLEAYNKAIESNPKDPEPYVRRATLHSKKEIEKTISDYSKAIELGTRDTHPYSARADFYRDRGQLNLAVADLTKVIELSPFGSNYRRRAVLHLAQSDYKRAISDIDAELSLKPSNAEQAAGYLLRGIVNQRSGALRQAFADFAKSESLVRNSIMLQYHRGIAHTASGDYEKAVDDLSKVIERGRTTVGTLRDPLAEKSITYRDMVVPGYTGRAAAHALAGRGDQGLSDVKEALKLDPDNASALKTRARILEALGRTD